VAISTYNGIALSYAQDVVEGIKKNKLDAKLLMGGLLNENLDNSALAVDVTDRIAELGVNTDNDATKIVDGILEIYRRK
ncbi:MAG: methylmalonyl-CoA mutase, partial [Synergistaceae bacterium]|nr:methylmalonyl-CoA mutase [Synergistaceae bacterium]